MAKKGLRKNNNKQAVITGNPAALKSVCTIV
jgi:malonyl CoA-acyl carrier protein transacylase